MKTELKIKSNDNKTMLHTVIWEPEGKPKAILQISHGMIEYIERYEEFAEFLNENGILVAGNDHLGHGKSVNSTDDWGYFNKEKGGSLLVRDLLKVTKKLKKMYPDVPVFLLGHSMGSFMARRYIINFGELLAGAVIMGTGNQPGALLVAGRALTRIIGKFKGDRYRSELATQMAFGAYNKRIENPQSPNAWISRDEEIVKKYDNTPETTFKFTVKGYNQIFETIQYVENKKMIDRIPKDLPILVISGDADPVGGYGKEVIKCYDAFVKAGIKDVSLELIVGARHEVLNEINRRETYELILNWIEERI